MTATPPPRATAYAALKAAEQAADDAYNAIRDAFNAGVGAPLWAALEAADAAFQTALEDYDVADARAAAAQRRELTGDHTPAPTPAARAARAAGAALDVAHDAWIDGLKAYAPHAHDAWRAARDAANEAYWAGPGVVTRKNIDLIEGEPPA